MYAFFALILFTLATLSGGASLLIFQRIGRVHQLMGPLAVTTDGETEMLLCLILCAVSLTGGALVVGMRQLLTQLRLMPVVPREEPLLNDYDATAPVPRGFPPRMARRSQAVPQMLHEVSPPAERTT
jgi:uncharacterized ion transporter superfamily protein YfcC